MLKGFEVHFRKFWYIDGWVIVTYPMRPICKIGCILENLAKKAPNFAPNWVLFAEKWYRDGSQNHAFRGIEMVEILNSTLSFPVRIFLKNPPPPPPPPGSGARIPILTFVQYPKIQGCILSFVEGLFKIDWAYPPLKLITGVCKIPCYWGTLQVVNDKIR